MPALQVPAQIFPLTRPVLGGAPYELLISEERNPQPALVNGSKRDALAELRIVLQRDRSSQPGEVPVSHPHRVAHRIEILLLHSEHDLPIVTGVEEELRGAIPEPDRDLPHIFVERALDE